MAGSPAPPARRLQGRYASRGPCTHGQAGGSGARGGGGGRRLGGAGVGTLVENLEGSLHRWCGAFPSGVDERAGGEDEGRRGGGCGRRDGGGGDGTVGVERRGQGGGGRGSGGARVERGAGDFRVERGVGVTLGVEHGGERRGCDGDSGEDVTIFEDDAEFEFALAEAEDKEKREEIAPACLKRPPLRPLRREVMGQVAEAFKRRMEVLAWPHWSRCENKIFRKRTPPLPWSLLAPLVEARVLEKESDMVLDEPPWFREELDAFALFPGGGGPGRFITHPWGSNPRVGVEPFTLPRPREVIRGVQGKVHLVKIDSRSHFHQIPLPGGLLGAWTVNIEKAGRVERYVLTRLPMGSRVAPCVGDAVTRYFAGVGEGGCFERAFVYIDDILVLDAEKAVEVAERVRDGGLEIGEWQVVGSEVCYIGILLSRRGEGVWWFRAAPKLRATLAERLEEVLRRGGGDFEEAERVVGKAVAFLEREGGDLVDIADTTRWMVGFGGRPHWTELPGAARAELAALLERVRNPLWRRVRTFEGAIVGATDASLVGWGAVLQVGEDRRNFSGQWGPGVVEAISMLELRAVIEGCRRSPDRVRIFFFVDSMVVIGWIRHGSARARLAAMLLRRLRDLLQKKGCALEAEYIRSESNPADGLSRGREAPLEVRWPVRTAHPQARILGEFESVYEGGGCAGLSA